MTLFIRVKVVIRMYRLMVNLLRMDGSGITILIAVLHPHRRIYFMYTMFCLYFELIKSVPEGFQLHVQYV